MAPAASRWKQTERAIVDVKRFEAELASAHDMSEANAP
jgi:hypothetical protein